MKKNNLVLTSTDTFKNVIDEIIRVKTTEIVICLKVLHDNPKLICISCRYENPTFGKKVPKLHKTLKQRQIRSLCSFTYNIFS